MMSDAPKTYRAAIIGCGQIAKLHASGYRVHPQTELVAVVDLNREGAEAFAAEQDCARATIHTDTAAMLEAEQPDLVSVCLWPQLHLKVAGQCLEAGVPAVHCEKPVAPTWGESRQLAAIAKKSGGQLTFNHQRRFSVNYSRGRALIDEGAIGAIRGIEGHVHRNVLDMGTHVIDLMNHYLGDPGTRWVIGQIDAREVTDWFGVPYEYLATGLVAYDNGLVGRIFCGPEIGEPSYGLRVEGEDGILELRGEDNIHLRRFGGEGKWEDLSRPMEREERLPITMNGVMSDVIAGLEGRHKPLLHVDNAMRATEIIFSLYESSRRRGRIDLPLEGLEDNPLHTMLREGVIGPGWDSIYDERTDYRRDPSKGGVTVKPA